MQKEKEEGSFRDSPPPHASGTVSRRTRTRTRAGGYARRSRCNAGGRDGADLLQGGRARVLDLVRLQAAPFRCYKERVLQGGG
jgi:hypothetical protein